MTSQNLRLLFHYFLYICRQGGSSQEEKVKNPKCLEKKRYWDGMKNIIHDLRSAFKYKNMKNTKNGHGHIMARKKNLQQQKNISKFKTPSKIQKSSK